MRDGLWVKGFVLGIIVLFIGSSSAGGYSGYLERLKGIQDTLNYESRLFDSSMMAGFDDIQKDIEYRKQVIAEEEQYQQLMEEEYLQYRNQIGTTHDDVFENNVTDLSPWRTFWDVHHPFFDTNNISIGIMKMRSLELRPLPTGNTLYVGGKGSGNFSKIQDAIDNATDGDTVFVYDDLSPYYENLYVKKSINLIGENKNTTIIDGKGDFIINLSANWINVSRFVIQNGTIGVLNYLSSNIIISENKINRTYYGIGGFYFNNSLIVDNSFLDNVIDFICFFGLTNSIANNTISTGEYGIAISGSNNIIINNAISSINQYGYGINLLGSSNIIDNNCINTSYTGIALSGYKNTIINNNISNNEFGIVLGNNTSNNIIAYNTLLSNKKIGIRLGESENIIIKNNVLQNNYYGFKLEDSDFNIITYNQLISSEISLSNSNNNIITRNKALGSNIYIGSSSKRETLTENTFYNSGVILFKDYGLMCSNTHIIDSTNLVNGKPLYYYKNQSSGMVPIDSGQIILANCTGMKISGSTLNNTADSIILLRSENISINSNHIYSNKGNGIDILDSDYITITDNVVTSNDGSGIFLFFAAKVIISHNNISNNAGDGISASPYAGEKNIQNNTILNNRGGGIVTTINMGDTIINNTISCNECGIWGSGGIKQSIREDIISLNVISKNKYNGIHYGYSEGNIFSKNYCDQNGISGILFEYDSFNNVVYNNTCVSNRIDGIGLDEGCSANTIANNTCLNNMKGIAVRDSESNYINNNTCKHNLQGILLNSADNNILRDNNCSYNSIGLYLYGSANNSIVRHRCNHSDFDGIVLENSSDYNVLSNNVAGPYNYVGIVIQTSAFNQLSHNDVYQNVGYGVVLLKTLGNHLHLNNIYENAEYDLIGLACVDNARWNYWGGGKPEKLVLGWVRLWPWLSNPAESSGNLDNFAVVKIV